MTPEYCNLDSFRRILSTIHSHQELSRIAIDEAHCISEWGHDFRPSFAQLCFFKDRFPDVPVMCLTATAPPRVRDDVIETMRLDPVTLKCFTMTTARPNLHYEIRFRNDAEDYYDDFLSWLRSVHKRRTHPGRAAELNAAGVRLDNVPGIIYTLYRRDCEALADRLVKDGIGSKPFHAGLTTQQKHDHLSGWVADKQGYDVIVATTAFGMGIDKNNVRFVVHWQLPKTFEGYYQEAGRAGRDGKAAACLLYYGREDRDRAFMRLTKDAEKKQRLGGGRCASELFAEGGLPDGLDAQTRHRLHSLQSLVAHCESVSGCRHKSICGYFGEDLSKKNTVVTCCYACDYCKDPSRLANRKNAGLASEQWCSTQRERGDWVDEYDC